MSENMRKAREAAGLIQKQVALTLHVSAPTVSDWEAGKISPSAANLKKLSELYGVPVDYLLENHGCFVAYLNQRVNEDELEGFAERCEIDAELLRNILGKAPHQNMTKLQNPISLGTDDIQRIAKELNVDWRYLACLYDGYNPHLASGVQIPTDDLTKTSAKLLDMRLDLFGTPSLAPNGGLTMDDFTYAMHNESKDLPPEKKDMLLGMARFMKQELDKEKGHQ